jgi:NCS1 family nucleobase:cation symporter-1
LFIALAQFTTNLTMNCLPSALVIMETTGLSWGTSVIIVGVLGIATMPWLLFTSQNFFSFIAYYSAFLGPVLGVMLADYFLIRKQKLVVRDLYSTAKGIYFYKEGWNWAGLAAVLIGGICGIIFLSYSWLIAMPVGFILYLVLYKVFDLPVGKEDELNSEPVFDIGD